MATVDYFAGQNEGTKNLLAALDSYTKDQRQQRQDALQNQLLQQKIAEGDIALDTANQRQAARAKMADIYTNPKVITPATTRLQDAVNPDYTPDAALNDYYGDTSVPATVQKQIDVPAVMETPYQQNQRAAGVALSSGQPELLKDVSTTIDLMDKIKPEESKTLMDAFGQGMTKFMLTGDPAKADQAVADYAAAHGIDKDKIEPGGVKWEKGIASMDLGGGNKAVIIPPIFGNKAEIKLIKDEKSPLDDNHLYAVSLQKDAQGNPTPQAQQAQAILDKKQVSAVEVSGAKAQKLQDVKSAEGFKSWTPEAKNQTFMSNLITGKPPVNAQGMGSNDRSIYGKEYAQWQVDKGFTPQDIALMQSDYKAGSLSLNNMTKQEAPMSAFVKNINLQIGKISELFNNNDRVGLRLLDLPVRDLKVKALGSGEEAVKASYLLEISNEIGKLSSGSSASIQQLSDSAKEDWKKVHDVNLSLKDIMTVVNATRDQANMRINTWRDAKEEVRNAIKGLGENTPEQPSPNRNDNNNPLHLKLGSQTQQHIDSGAATIDNTTAKDGGNFLKFNDPQQGLTAAWDLLFNSPTYNKLSVNDAMLKWSNKGYGGDVVPELRGKKIADLTRPERSQLIIGMMKREGTLKRTGVDVDTGRKVALLSNGAQIYVE